ncbi:MAG TPA: hypothetical protein VFD36_17695 [Kofleriaceae bacterium]|nr:hypothetical protein [Kofleriaceae bacterium]
MIWNLDDVDDATVVKAHMNRWSNEPSDKVIIDPAELEPTGPPALRAISGELRISLARGTREQVVTRPMMPESVQIPWPSGLERRSREDQDDERERVALERRSREDQDTLRERAPERRSREDQDTLRERAPERRKREDQDTQRERSALGRDPIAVLRAWPHSTSTVAEPPARPAGALPSPRRRRVQDKMMLAHLALDLYQELDQLQAIVQHADDMCPSDTEAAPCSDPRCAATTDMLRGALVEACLLVQRVAMTPPEERADIEDRIHELLAVLHQ